MLLKRLENFSIKGLKGKENKRQKGKEENGKEI